MKTLVTGGAGFIGSHLVDYLIERGDKVRVIDNLSAGSLDNLRRWLDDPDLEFIEGDITNPDHVMKSLEGCDAVYHIAANPEVRSSKASPDDHFRQNIQATYNLLEGVRQGKGVESVVFTSTSTVYGEATTIPTPEGYGPMKPISHYGASKLAAEALLCSYASMQGFRCVIYRLANVVGPRSNHGVTYDFVQKLKRNPRTLEVLGDGTQSKSYLHVRDCVEGMVQGVEATREQLEVLNIGSDDQVDVLSIARIVGEEMDLGDVEILLTGGVEGGRGWKGDVKLMQLDTSRLRSLGWRPKMGSAEAIRTTARWLVSS
jgi:UDP-glucose 4-epimerase